MRITELFDNGEFVVSAEVGPPKGIHIDGMVEEAKKYLGGVHAVNVTDNQSSVMRLGSLATCKVLKDAGLNPIFQLTCRDRNRIALESDLLSAAMLGIDNILCLTGGICPITACSKSLVNGPCGGTSRNGKCEVCPEMDCGWERIIQRLKAQGRLDVLRCPTQLHDFNTDEATKATKES